MHPDYELITKAFRSYYRGNYPYTIRLCKKLFGTASENDAKNLLGRCLLEMKDEDAVLAIIKTLLDDTKNLAAASHLIGVIDFYHLDYDSAYKNFCYAIKMHPSFANYYYSRGVIQLRRANIKEAFDDFDMAIKMENFQAESYLGKAMIHYFLRNYDQAIKLATQALQIERKLSRAYYIRGLSKYKNGEWDKAQKDLFKSNAIDTKHQFTILSLGNCALRKGDFLKALDYFNQIDKANQYYCYAINNRGVAYYHLGDFQTALNEFALAREKNPELLIPLVNRTQVNKKLNCEDEVNLDMQIARSIKYEKIEIIHSDLAVNSLDKDPRMTLYDNLIDMLLKI